MSGTKIIITTEQMRQIARYEYTFKWFFPLGECKDVAFVCPEVYTFTLDDLFHAVKALKEADPYVREFGQYWLALPDHRTFRIFQFKCCTGFWSR